MNDIFCDKCGSETTPKVITSKKNGQTYTVYQCKGGCMNGKWPYTCFAPKAPPFVQQPAIYKEPVTSVTKPQHATTTDSQRLIQVQAQLLSLHEKVDKLTSIILQHPEITIND